MATLTVTFGTEVVAVTETAARWDPAAQVDQASATLIGMGQAVVSLPIVFVIVWLPLILTVLLDRRARPAVALRGSGSTSAGGLPPVTPPDDTAVLGGGLIEEDRADRVDGRPGRAGQPARPAHVPAVGMARSRG